MIISYPYLPEPTNSASEVSYRERIEACLRGHGTYPVSYDMCWHGGVHLARQFDEAGVDAVLPRLPRQIERVDGEDRKSVV